MTPFLWVLVVVWAVLMGYLLGYLFWWCPRHHDHTTVAVSDATHLPERGKIRIGDEKVTEIRDRLEAKAGAVAGTRPYWDCVAALLDVAERAEALIATAGGLAVTNAGAMRCVQVADFDALGTALAALLPQGEPE